MCVTGQCVCMSVYVRTHAFKRISQLLNYFQTTVSAAWSWIPREKSTNLVHQVKSDLRLISKGTKLLSGYEHDFFLQQTGHEMFQLRF